MIKVPFTVMTGTKYPQMLQGLVKVVSLFYQCEPHLFYIIQPLLAKG